jgi:hypothetical protein
MHLHLAFLNVIARSVTQILWFPVFFLVMVNTIPCVPVWLAGFCCRKERCILKGALVMDEEFYWISHNAASFHCNYIQTICSGSGLGRICMSCQRRQSNTIVLKLTSHAPFQSRGMQVKTPNLFAHLFFSLYLTLLSIFIRILKCHCKITRIIWFWVLSRLFLFILLTFLHGKRVTQFLPFPNGWLNFVPFQEPFYTTSCTNDGLRILKNSWIRSKKIISQPLMFSLNV